MSATNEKAIEIYWQKNLTGVCFLCITSAVTGKIDVRGLA